MDAETRSFHIDGPAGLALVGMVAFVWSVKSFGKEASFEPPRQSCMYAEFGFSIGQGAAGFLRFNVAQCTNPRVFTELSRAMEG